MMEIRKTSGAIRMIESRPALTFGGSRRHLRGVDEFLAFAVFIVDTNVNTSISAHRLVVFLRIQHSGRQMLPRHIWNEERFNRKSEPVGMSVLERRVPIFPFLEWKAFLD